MNQNNLSELTLSITDLSEEGAGIGRAEGLVTFVEGLIPGDVAKIKILEKKKNFLKGEAVQLLEKSPDRITPPCVHYQNCGGCTLQHMSYKAQLKFKFTKVNETLKRLGKFNSLADIIVPSEKEYCYRNSVVYHLARTGNNIVLGFNKRRSHSITDITDCLIVPPEFQKLINEIRTIFNSKFQMKKLPEDIKLRKLMPQEKSIFVGFYFNKDISRKDLDALAQALPKTFEENKIEYFFFNDAKKMTIKNEVERESYSNGKLSMRVSLDSFFQTNSYQLPLMLDYLSDLVGKPEFKTGKLLDLYCGAGIFSIWLKDKFEHITGTDSAKSSIKDGRTTLSDIKVDNIKFYNKEVDGFLKEFKFEPDHFDTIVIDPPRTGLTEEVIKFLLDSQYKKLVYISCNPATLARDIAKLKLPEIGNYKIRIFDLFPQTTHVETMFGYER